MNDVPFHYWPAVAVAVRIGQVIARIGLCHPVSDTAGDSEVMDWAADFAKKHGSFPSSIGSPTDRLAFGAYEKALEEFAHQRARFGGWLAPELRSTMNEHPADNEFHCKIEAVKRIRALPPSLPITCANKALLEQVTTELAYRALHQLELGAMPGGVNEEPAEAMLSVGRDGRFHKLFAHGVSIASAIPALGDTPVLDEWISAVRSTLGVQLNPGTDHQVLVEVNGRPIACTSHEVRVEVINHRLSEDGDSSLLLVLTEEGVVTDLTRQGEFVATQSQMYDDIACDLTPNDRGSQTVGA